MIETLELTTNKGTKENWYVVDKRRGNGWQSWSNGWASKMLNVSCLNKVKTMADLENVDLAYNLRKRLSKVDSNCISNIELVEMLEKYDFKEVVKELKEALFMR